MEAFLVFLFIIFAVVVVVAITLQKVEEHRHSNNIAPTQLSDIGARGYSGGGSWVVSVFRQSGNPYRDDVVFHSKQAEISAKIK